MLADKPVPVEKTKTFGYSIKWPGKRDYADAAPGEWAKEKVTIEEIDLEGVKKLLANEGINYKLIIPSFWLREERHYTTNRELLNPWS